MKFHRQLDKNACGIASIRAVLENGFRIVKTEKNLINLAEMIYEFLHYGNPPNNDYIIADRIEQKGNGARVYHLANIGKAFGLRAFSSSRGKVSDLIWLLDNGIPPIIHRPFEEDGKGHYVVPYAYNHSMYVFNPAKGYGCIKEPYPLFDRKWSFGGERWFFILYKPGFKVPFKGRYL